MWSSKLAQGTRCPFIGYKAWDTTFQSHEIGSAGRTFVKYHDGPSGEADGYIGYGLPKLGGLRSFVYSASTI